MSSIQSLNELHTVATPAATMRTYAGSTTRPAADVAVWRSELPVGTPGPVHVVDRDHVVVVLDGALSVEVDGEVTVVPEGGAVVLPAGASRQLAAHGDGPAVTLTAARPGSLATIGDGEPVEVPWAR